MPVALPVDTQVFDWPSPPAMVRFWNPKGSIWTVRGVTTLPSLAEPATEPELNLDRLQLAPTPSGAVKARIKVGVRLEFRAGDGDLVLDRDEE